MSKSNLLSRDNFCVWNKQVFGNFIIQVKLTKISYIATLFKFGLYRILFYSKFGLYRILFYSKFGLYRILFYSKFVLFKVSFIQECFIQALV